MSSIQHLAVSPKLPTTLADQTHLDLPGHDIVLFHVNSLHVIPTELNVSRFEDALSRALQLYPHAAGKFRYVDRRWVIELTNSAIPLDIEYKLDSVSANSFRNGDWVFLDDYSPFIGTHPMFANVYDNSVPLLCVKLTFFNNETCICLAWHHSLGDATVQFRFLHAVSQFYQGLSPLFAAPNFKKHHFPTPSESVVADIWPRIPQFHKTCDFEAFSATTPCFELLTWRIDISDTEELHSALSSKTRNGPSLSKLDCIIAYLVAVLNHTRSNPVRSVRNLTSYRHVKAPFVSENEAGNLFLDVTANVPMDMAGVATTIRNAVTQCHDPDYIHSWVAVTSNLKLEAYSAWKGFPSIAVDDEFIVNSLAAIDLCSAHFGYPDGTQCHLGLVVKDSALITRSNPVKGADGVWRPRRSVDISMGVTAEMKPRLLETLALGVRYMLKEELARL